MTLLHITCGNGRALFATDTTTYRSDVDEPGADVLYHSDGAPAAVAKLHPLPHLRCVLASRGSGLIARRALWAIEDNGARDFEDAAQILADFLPTMPPAGGTYKGEPLRHELHVVGWSEREGCMRLATLTSPGYRLRLQGNARGCSGTYGPMPVRPAWLHEPGREAETTAYLLDEARHFPRCLQTAAAYARRAVETAREEDPDAPYGGRLIVAELTKDTLTMQDFGDLGLPPRRPGARDIITRIPGLVLAGALAACGGGADEVATTYIASGAATGVSVNVDATVYDITSFLGSVDPPTPAAPVTVTLDGDETAVIVTVEMSFVFEKTLTTAGDLAYFDGTLYVREGSTDHNGQAVYLELVASANSQTLKDRRMFTTHASITGLSAGSHTFGARWEIDTSAGAGGDAKIDNVRTRVEVIKR